MNFHRTAALAAGLLTIVGTLPLVTALRADQDASAAQSEMQMPPEALVDFLAAIQTGRIVDARSMIYGSDAMPHEALEEYLRDVMTASQRGFRPAVFGHLQLGDCAIVIIDDSAPNAAKLDLDPAYLLRQDRQWMVLPEISEYDSRFISLAAGQSRDFAALERWFDEQKPKLQALLRHPAADRDESVTEGTMSPS